MAFWKRNKFDEDDGQLGEAPNPQGTKTEGNGVTTEAPKPAEEPQTAQPAPAAQPQATTGTPQPAQAKTEAQSGEYSVDNVIELMRMLPEENIELVVSVLKKTLESVKISVPSLIEGAIDRQTELSSRITSLQKGIQELEAEIKAKRSAIGELESKRKEVITVRERLVLAQNIEARKSSLPAPAPAKTAQSAHPKIAADLKPSRTTGVTIMGVPTSSTSTAPKPSVVTAPPTSASASQPASKPLQPQAAPQAENKPASKTVSGTVELKPKESTGSTKSE